MAINPVLVLAIYCGSGAVVGAISAFCFDFDWYIFSRRCPTYGEFIARIIIGAFSGLPVLAFVAITGAFSWFVGLPYIKAFLNRQMCRRESPTP